MQKETQQVWERSAKTDLWLRTLQQIHSVFGRLVYLAGLRDVNTGLYQHHGLSASWGKDDTHSALRESHEYTFAEWLTYSLEEQKADLDLYLSNLDVPKKSLLKTWQRLAPYKNLIPTSALNPERNLYLLDLEMLLELLRNESAGQGASPRQIPGR